MLRLHLCKRVAGFFAITVGLFLWVGCSNPSSNSESCKTNGDCKAKERCVKRKCATVDIANTKPIAVIAGETKARQSAVLRLSGFNSSDPDGNTPLTFAWSFVERPSGSKAAFDKPTQAAPSFTADVGGTFIVQLIVTDSKGAKSDPARHTISVFGTDQNEKPTADAGPDQVAGVGIKVQLDGARSKDPEGDVLTYEWTLKALPDGSASTIKDAKTKSPSFTPDKTGKYIVQLVVHDGLESSDPDTMTVEVLDDFGLKPSLSKLDPAVGFSGTTVQVVLTGDGFSKQASVLFDGIAVLAGKVKYDNATTLVVTLELTKKPGEYDIKVRNPNREESTALKFTIKTLPPPTFAKMIPNVGIAGAKYDIKVSGTGFVKGANEANSSNVLFQLVPMPTTVTNDKELVFKLDLSKTLAGEYDVQVRNPGNRSSSKLKFTVLPEANSPILKVLNPPNGGEGKKIPFSVHGTGFLQGAVIVFNGKAIPSKRIRRDEVDADPSLDLTTLKEGKYKVWVRNPDGKISNKEEFEVEGKDPTPNLDRILPFFVYLNDTTTLNIYGQRFRPGIKLFLGNQEISGKNLQFKSTSYLVATIDTTKGTWKAGDVLAYVMNTNKKKSNQFKITITYRVPSISNLTPSGWNTQCDTDVRIFGSNFAKTAKLTFFNTVYTTTSATNKLTFVSNKELKIRLNASKLSPSPTSYCNGTSRKCSTGYACASSRCSYQVFVENGPNAKSSPVGFPLVSGSSIAKPSIREVRPAAGRADTKVSALLYATSNSTSKRFELGAVVTLDGKVQKTSCSGTSYCYSLTAELDLTGLKPGVHKIRVVNPCNNAGPEASFLVTEAPQPFISQIAPPYANVGDSKIIAVRGLNFSKNAKLLWGGKVVAATVKSEKEIVTDKAISFVGATAGTTVDVVVDNGNSKKSPPVKFSILAAKYEPYISAVSTYEFERGKVHNGVIITGRGYTKNSVVYFNGNKVTTKYSSGFQLTADGLDFKTLKVGTYYIHVEEGGKKSNLYPVLAKPFPPPVLSRVSPTVFFEGSGTQSLTLYGDRFCKTNGSRSSYRCITNPKVVVIDSAKKVLPASTVVVTYTHLHNTHSSVRGNFNTSGLKAGVYLVYFELPTGERSNPAPVTIKPIPDPTIERLSPSTGLTGRSFSFSIYAKHFCPSNTSNRCTTNPIVSIVGPPGSTEYGTKGKNVFRITYTYTYPTSSSARVSGTFDAATLKEGTYKIQLQHPISNKKSNVLNFVLRPSPPPHIGYVRNSNYYFFDIGTQKSYSIYGGNFPSSAFLRKGLSTYPLTGTSSFRRSLVFDTKGMTEGHLTVTMQGPNGKSSLPFSIALSKRGGKPTITHVYGSSTSTPMYPNRSYTLYVYGFNWPRTSSPTIYLDGKAITNSRYCYYRGSYYQYCTFRSFSTAGMKAGKHTVRYEATYSGKQYKTTDYEFYLAKSPPPSITSLSPSSVTHGWKGTVTVYGSEFANGAFVAIGLRTFPLRYSSSSRAYLDSFDTKSFKKGDVLKMVVVNPDNQRSQPFNFSIK